MLLLCGAPPSDSAASEVELPPNVIVLLADDLGYGDVSMNGSEIPTPRIDSIARRGVRFSSGYVTTPQCNPARAGLLSGRYPQRWGQELNQQVDPPIGSIQRAFPLTLKTIADAMREAGYATAAVGKWHQRLEPGYHPLDRGFDSFYGTEAGMHYAELSWPGRHYGSFLFWLDRRINPKGPLYDGREPTELREYLPLQLAREAVGFIDRNQDRPFFLYLAFLMPHTPMEVTDEFYGRFPGVDDETKRVYSGMVSALDDAVGLVLDRLRETGLEERTLVIFTSDNGAAKYIDTDGSHNQPLTGHKRNLYEGGIRVPLAVQWKGQLPEGGTYHHPISALDIFPTAAAVAGLEDVEAYELDGTNFLPGLRGESSDAAERPLFWRFGPHAAVRQGPYKLLFLAGGRTRLYDVDADPGESIDLSAERPEVVRSLTRAYDSWNAELPKPPTSRSTVTTRFNGDSVVWQY